MTRAEKIDYLILAIFAVEGVRVTRDYFDDYTDITLEKECEFYDYLLTK